MELTEKTELKIEDSYFHYTINDIIKPVRQQILTNQRIIEETIQIMPYPYMQMKAKAEKWDKVIQEDNAHEGVCNVEVNLELKRENKQLKEERDLLRNTGAFYLKETSNLRLKLEKIKEYLTSQDKEGECRTCHSNDYHNLKEILDSQEKIERQPQGKLKTWDCSSQEKE